MRPKTVLFLLITAVLVYFSVFHHLGTPPIKIWDESLFAMRAYYFAQTGMYLPDFSYFPGISGYRNLKPPLGTWIQGLSFRVFGAGELPLRLPIALFAVMTMAATAGFLKQVTGSFRPGWIFTLIMLSCPGYIREHVVRTGDQDVLYVFFLLMQVFFFILYQRDERQKHLWLLGAAVLATFLVKSIMAFFLFPAFLLFTALRQRWALFLRNPAFYTVLLLGLLSIAGYYLVMESITKGFFEMVLETVWGRYISVRDEQKLPVTYYATQFLTYRFLPWWALLFLGLLRFSRPRVPVARDLLALLWLALPSFLLIITLSRTKLQWYDAALYPLAALIVALYLHTFLSDPAVSKRLKQLVGGAGAVCFIWGYAQVMRANDYPAWEHPSEQFGYMIKHLEIEHPEVRSFLIYADEYNGQVGFYSQLLNDRGQRRIEVMNYWGQKEVNRGTVIMVCHQDKLQKLRSEVELATISEFRGCVVGKVE